MIVRDNYSIETTILMMIKNLNMSEFFKNEFVMKTI